MKFKMPSQTPPGLWRRMPPAVFPTIMGLLGLGLAWRQAAHAVSAPPGIGEAVLGAATLLFAFAFVAYFVKLLRRPTVIVDDLRILPGQAGVGSMVLCLYLVAMTLAPYAPSFAHGLLFAGFAVHAGLVILLIHQLVRGPAAQRRVTPVWHLNYAGFVIGGLAAAGFEYYFLALGTLFVSALAATFVWSVCVEHMVRGEAVPPPLRPLLAIHLAPVALIGLLAHALELDAVALGCAGVAALILAFQAIRLRWLTEAGFSAFWGAFTFPLAATASLWLVLGGRWEVAGGLVLVAASLVIPAISIKILRLWAGGQLAIKTNAAIA